MPRLPEGDPCYHDYMETTEHRSVSEGNLAIKLPTKPELRNAIRRSAIRIKQQQEAREGKLLSGDDGMNQPVSAESDSRWPSREDAEKLLDSIEEGVRRRQAERDAQMRPEDFAYIPGTDFDEDGVRYQIVIGTSEVTLTPEEQESVPKIEKGLLGVTEDVFDDINQYNIDVLDLEDETGRTPLTI